MSEGELLERFGAIGSSSRPVRASSSAVLPHASPLCELLLTSPGLYDVLEFLPADRAVLAGQLCGAAGRLGVWWRTGFAAAGALSAGYIILMLQPFQVTMVPTLPGLKTAGGFWTPTWRRFSWGFSGVPVLIMAKFLRTIPRPLIEAAKGSDGAGIYHFLRVGVPIGKPGITRPWSWAFGGVNAIEQPMTFF